MNVHVAIDDQEAGGTALLGVFASQEDAKAVCARHNAEALADPEAGDPQLTWEPIPEYSPERRRRSERGPDIDSAGGPGIWAETDWGGLLIIEAEVH